MKTFLPVPTWFLLMTPVRARVMLMALMTVTCAKAALPEPRFRAVNIDTNLAIGYGVAVGDVDGDKRPDIVVADKHQIAWYQNPSWTKHVIAEKLTELDHVCLAVADLNEDGRAEIAVGAGWNPGDTLKSGANFFLRASADPTRPWTPITLPHEPTVHRMHWIRTPSGVMDLVVVPLHGRGNKNGQGEGVRIMAYRPPPTPDGSWRAELVDGSLHMTHNFQPVMWEGKAWHELLVGGKEGVFHLAKSANGWRRQQLVGNEPGETAFVGAGEIREGRMRGDRKFLATIEPMHGNQAVVYFAPAAGSPRKLWERRVLDESLVDGHAVGCADFLGLGSDQIVVGWRAMNRPGIKVGLKLFTPQDDGGEQWRTTLIDDNHMACEDLRVADLNADGKPDIVASGRATRNLIWYVNERESDPKP